MGKGGETNRTRFRREPCVGILRENKEVTGKPDLLVVLVIAFGIGLLVTLLLPATATDSVAAPASELQAGVIIQD